MKRMISLITIILGALSIHAYADNFSAKTSNLGGEKLGATELVPTELLEERTGSSDDAFIKAFKIINRTGITITYLYFSPDYSDR